MFLVANHAGPRKCRSKLNEGGQETTANNSVASLVAESSVFQRHLDILITLNGRQRGCGRSRPKVDLPISASRQTPEIDYFGSLRLSSTIIAIRTPASRA